MYVVILHEMCHSNLTPKRTTTFTAILYYDWYLTFPVEVSGVWARNKSTISWIFFINRYLTLSGQAINVALDMMSLGEEVSAIIILL